MPGREGTVIRSGVQEAADERDDLDDDAAVGRDRRPDRRDGAVRHQHVGSTHGPGIRRRSTPTWTKSLAALMATMFSTGAMPTLRRTCRVPNPNISIYPSQLRARAGDKSEGRPGRYNADNKAAGAFVITYSERHGARS